MPEEQQQKPSSDALKDIEDRLNALKRDVSGTRQAQTTPTAHPIGQMMWLAFNVISDLIAGVICGFGIGYGIDRWLGTRPIFIAVFLIFGCIAGVFNVVRFLHRYEERQRQKQPNDTREKE